jgi:hypothetical protein
MKKDAGGAASFPQINSNNNKKGREPAKPIL